MKKILSAIALFCTVYPVFAQDDVYPAPAQKGILFIKNATIHVGNGQVIQNGMIQVENGIITKTGTDIPVPSGNSTVIDAKGKQVYPGLILPNSDVGLREIANAVRGSNDFSELGDWNSNIRSIVAYNTDSRVIGVLRANGILLANVSPEGTLIAGSSSVVQLDAWNYEDAAYKTDVAMNFYMPNLLARPGGRFGGFQQGQQPQGDPVKEGMAKIEEVKKFFREARAYLQEANHNETNIKFESLRNLFDRKQKLFIHCNEVKQMLQAIEFVKEFNIDVVIVGGSDSWQIADLLKKNNIAVILTREHSLPTLEDDDIDQPYKTASLLQKTGVLFALNDDFAEPRYRNLPFNAGTAAAYGLSKEDALSAITLNTAKILGINDRTGSIETGKDANIVISEGDILDMRTSIITDAYIQGRKVSLENKQTQLFHRYMTKYGLN